MYVVSSLVRYKLNFCCTRGILGSTVLPDVIFLMHTDTLMLCLAALLFLNIFLLGLYIPLKLEYKALPCLLFLLSFLRSYFIIENDILTQI